jgi:hypothetical protein
MSNNRTLKSNQITKKSNILVQDNQFSSVNVNQLNLAEQKNLINTNRDRTSFYGTPSDINVNRSISLN